MISVDVGLAAVPSILALCVLYGGGGAYDSDATHAFNVRQAARRMLLKALTILDVSIRYGRRLHRPSDRQNHAADWIRAAAADVLLVPTIA